MHNEEIKIEIVSCASGWFEFSFKTEAKEYSVPYTSLLLDPTKEILHWLEEMVTDADNEEFNIEVDTESASYDIISLKKLNESYALTVRFDEKVFFDAIVDKYQFIKAFYSAIVNFYHSDRYDREANEAKYIYEVFYEKFGFDILGEKSMDYMLTRNKISLENLLHGIGNEPLLPKDVSFPRQCNHIIKNARENFHDYPMSDLVHWDYSDAEFESIDEKTEAIKKAIMTNVKDSWSNFRLQEFYSEEIETYLLERDGKQLAGHDYIDFDYTVSDELRINVYINGVELFKDEGIGFDIKEMISSLKKDGEYALYVCSGCGIEGCGGIFESPQVTSDKGIIVWTIFKPKPYTFRFKKAQLLSAFETLKEKMLKDKTLEEWKNISMYFSRVDFLEGKNI